MIETLPQKGHPFLKLLLIAAAIYAFYNKEKIHQGLSQVLAKNQTVQETKGTMKWLYDELRPRTEAEKKQSEAFGKKYREDIADLRKNGISGPHVRYVMKEDGEEYEQAKKDWPELRKQLLSGIEK